MTARSSAQSQSHTQTQVTPEPLLQLGLAFWGSKTFLTAVELGVFTHLARGPQVGQQLAEELKLHPRGWRDFFDTLVALKLLERDGQAYRNTPATEQFLDRNKPSYLGGFFEMCSARLYPAWGSLREALLTGEPQNESKNGDATFDALYADKDRMRGFLSAMTGISMGNARAIAAKFDWSKYKTFVDIGTAQGCVPVTLASMHKHLNGVGFDLPIVKPVFEEYVAAHHLSDRVKYAGGDFFKEELPRADVLIFGHILHDWDLPTKKMLLKKAYNAVPAGGSVIVYDAMIDNDRCENAFGLLMSLNMLIETRGGFDYTVADGTTWMQEAGFRHVHTEPLTGPHTMLVGVR
jgi:hypothetical protein